MTKGEKIMLIKVLASGSSGNSCFIKTKQAKFLIDVGITKKRIEDELNKINESIVNLDFILITHEHIDHIKGLLMVLKYSKALVYLTLGTLEGLFEREDFVKFYNLNKERFIILSKNGNDYYEFNLLDLNVKPLIAFHDAKEPVGFLICNEDKKVTYLTDTGYIHQDVMNLIKNCTCYIFETNHDPEILMNSSRPYQLKMRILSDYGHLSNADSLYALANLVGKNTKYIICAHISSECNLREIILLTYKKIFQKLGIDNTNIKLVMSLPNALEAIEL